MATTPSSRKPEEKLASLDKPAPSSRYDVAEDRRQHTEAEMLEYVRVAEAQEDDRVYNKDSFYAPHGASSKYPRLDERGSRRTEHWVTAEALALDILMKANIAWLHPELVKPLSEAIKSEVKKHEGS